MPNTVKCSTDNENFGFMERARELVSKMTLAEKISQLLHNSSEIDRLGIPAYNWWNECLHGVAGAGVATMFPQAIGLAATFDESLLETLGDVISTEGRAKYHEFQRQGENDMWKGLTFWAPNINIFRDPRWGRGQETYGEDPYLTGRLGVAFIKGIQGYDKKYLKASACAKHFAVHSGPESERHHFNAVVSVKDLRETYLPAFEACVTEGKVSGIMGAYNMINGEPCCGSEMLLKKILREEWGFDGYVTSDCWAIQDFNEGHKVTNCITESAALALKSGCNLNCGCAYASLLRAFHDGIVTEEEINESITRLINIRMKLGMFDEPESVSYSKISYQENDCEAHRLLSLEAAKNSLVLLKNENNLLPLDLSSIKSVAVIGPNADSREALIGNYCGTASEYVTVLQGIREYFKNTRIYYAEGCHLWRDRWINLTQRGDRITEAKSAAQSADITIVCLGLNANIEGEEGISTDFPSGDKTDLNLPGLQNELLEAVCSTGKPVILVLLSGSPISIAWAGENVPAIIQAWYPGSQGGRAIASLLLGEFSPSGRLPVTFYRDTNELPDIHDYSMEGRTYRYMKNEALYPFGYGLSYSKFLYSGLCLSSAEITADESIELKVRVKNIGNVDASEAVQLYLKDLQSSVRVPKYQLAGIKKLKLKPQEEAEVMFTISSRQMALIDDDGQCKLEPGFFEVYIGGSQPDCRSRELTGMPVLKGSFEVTTYRELKY